MFKKISNLQLIGILVLLGLIYFFLDFTGDKGRSKAFRQNLVEIDTGKATSVKFSKPGVAFELSKDAGGWNLILSNQKVVKAQASSVKYSLNHLGTIKPSRIVARDPSKWKDYLVDSAGTRIQVFQGDTKSLDIVIGRFGVKGQNQFHTFVRLFEDDEVYLADNFLGLSFGTDPGSYRDGLILTTERDSVNYISFSYPADSSYTVIKSANGQWIADGAVADSASMVKQLNGYRIVRGNDYVDELTLEDLASPTYSLSIRSNGQKEVSIRAFKHPVHTWIIHSSLNPQSLFSDDGTKVIANLFFSRQEFFPNP